MASGLRHATCSALFRLAFAPAPALPSLNLAAYRNSQVHSTKGTPPPLRAVTSCRFMVSGSISLPSPGFFSPFPHGTRSLSVAEEYLALRGGPRRFQQGSTCPVVLGCFYIYMRHNTFTGLLPTLARLSSPVLLSITHKRYRLHSITRNPTTCIWQRYNAYTHIHLGSSLFARRY